MSLETSAGQMEIIPARHRCAAIKAQEKLELPTHLEEEICQMTLECPLVWASHKLLCGLVPANIHVPGPDPPPQHQYEYPQEAELSIWKTIEFLLEQDVITTVWSTRNSPVWPIVKSDGVTWRLTIHY